MTNKHRHLPHFLHHPSSQSIDSLSPSNSSSLSATATIGSFYQLSDFRNYRFATRQQGTKPTMPHNFIHKITYAGRLPAISFDLAHFAVGIVFARFRAFSLLAFQIIYGVMLNPKLTGKSSPTTSML